MGNTERTVPKPAPDVNDRPSSDDRKYKRDSLRASDLVFYVSITVAAVVLCAIFWALFGGQ